MPEDNQNNREQLSARSPRFKSVHRCAYCGAIVHRDDVTEDAMITGVFECPECSRSGPLNVVVIDT